MGSAPGRMEGSTAAASISDRKSNLSPVASAASECGAARRLGWSSAIGCTRYFQKAADKGLIEEVQLRAEVGEINNQGGDETNKCEGDIKENTFEDIEDTSEISCMSGC